MNYFLTKHSSAVSHLTFYIWLSSTYEPFTTKIKVSFFPNGMILSKNFKMARVELSLKKEVANVDNSS